jgi:hypothetical protein
MNYYLRDLDPILWHRLKTKALARHLSLRELILSLLTTWLKEG